MPRPSLENNAGTHPGLHTYEVIVIGAGICGLSSAKSYLHCSPNTSLLILDDHKTLGGVWSQENIYPALRTNNHRGTFELPDFPFSDKYGIPPGAHPTGAAMHQYFCDYAEKFGLVRCLRLETRVTAVEKGQGGWRVSVESSSTAGGKYEVFTEKLIIAVGLTSKPLKMTVRGQDSYGAPHLHAGSLAREVPELVEEGKVERVTVYGGSKFAWDSVYAFASRGKEVDWVIAKSGHGSTWILNVTMVLPIFGTIWAERLVTTRFIDWFSPSVFGGLDGSGWWRWILHSTRVGRKIVAGFWKTVQKDMLEQSGFNAHPSLEKVKPDCELFDIATSFSTLNYPTNILDYIASGQVKVHREDISHMSDHKIHLKNGTELRSDAFIASSGWDWRPKFDLKPESMHAEFGVPSQNYSPEEKQLWEAYDRKADAEIFRRFPMLRNRKYPPVAHEERKANPLDALSGKQEKYEPQRLYRCIAPPGLAARGDRSLAFSQPNNVSHAITDELAGLWIYAYLNDKLSIDPQRDLGMDEVYYSAALYQRWSWRRHPYGFGQRWVDMMWDAVPYHDVLLKDLGLTPTRKPGWGPLRWFREAFVPYTTADYRGVADEWLAKQKMKSV
ncbi:uncharacterized protein MYCFIDRAFT_217008 [Pseudocercospora fijiensis CIRAD86]|uniref:FAD/NAD(P)-binding domain-containing protein n=1 Tax=Pseudocercospora fijiensis (strain CIRAD86) TaxID=383855 RepID=M3A1F1_PSEFD|nr:uncharacterized protein MYCFIDRAFT_217008 [Pseudocercospora fijiensis CIRAD86]EME78206.1 hypothetical protein MYCFIDRAFT_217008 [Pseudocercospora fijiensis CIRAD86]